MEKANTLFDLYNQAKNELDKIDTEIFLLYHPIVSELADKGMFNEAREKLFGMPECMSKFDLIRYVRAKQIEMVEKENKNLKP